MKKKQFFGSFKIFIMLTILLVVLSYIYIYYLRGGQNQYDQMVGGIIHIFQQYLIIKI